MDGRRLVEAPFRLLGGVHSTTRGAVANARDAAAAIAAAVTDRQALTASLAPEVPVADGHLRSLTKAECYQVLARGTIGRLAYLARAGTPDIAPVNYALDGTDVLIRSGPGPKLQAAERGDLVAFEVDEVDRETHTGCSVIVYGAATKIPLADQKSQPESPAPSPWVAGPRHHTIRIHPSRITGRCLGSSGPGPTDNQEQTP